MPHLSNTYHQSTYRLVCGRLLDDPTDKMLEPNNESVEWSHSDDGSEAELAEPELPHPEETRFEKRGKDGKRPKNPRSDIDMDRLRVRVLKVEEANQDTALWRNADTRTAFTVTQVETKWMSDDFLLQVMASVTVNSETISADGIKPPETHKEEEEEGEESEHEEEEIQSQEGTETEAEEVVDKPQKKKKAHVHAPEPDDYVPFGEKYKIIDAALLVLKKEIAVRKAYDLKNIVIPFNQENQHLVHIGDIAMHAMPETKKRATSFRLPDVSITSVAGDPIESSFFKRTDTMQVTRLHTNTTLDEYWADLIREGHATPFHAITNAAFGGVKTRIPNGVYRLSDTGEYLVTRDGTKNTMAQNDKSFDFRIKTRDVRVKQHVRLFVTIPPGERDTHSVVNGYLKQQLEGMHIPDRAFHDWTLLNNIVRLENVHNEVRNHLIDDIAIEAKEKIEIQLRMMARAKVSSVAIRAERLRIEREVWSEQRSIATRHASSEEVGLRRFVRLHCKSVETMKLKELFHFVNAYEANESTPGEKTHQKKKPLEETHESGEEEVPEPPAKVPAPNPPPPHTPKAEAKATSEPLVRMLAVHKLCEELQERYSREEEVDATLNDINRALFAFYSIEIPDADRLLREMKDEWKRELPGLYEYCSAMRKSAFMLVILTARDMWIDYVHGQMLDRWSQFQPTKTEEIPRAAFDTTMRVIREMVFDRFRHAGMLTPDWRKGQPAVETMLRNQIGLRKEMIQSRTRVVLLLFKRLAQDFDTSKQTNELVFLEEQHLSDVENSNPFFDVYDWFDGKVSAGSDVPSGSSSLTIDRWNEALRMEEASLTTERMVFYFAVRLSSEMFHWNRLHTVDEVVRIGNKTTTALVVNSLVSSKAYLAKRKFLNETSDFRRVAGDHDTREGELAINVSAAAADLVTTEVESNVRMAIFYWFNVFLSNWILADALALNHSQFQNAMAHIQKTIIANDAKIRESEFYKSLIRRIGPGVVTHDMIHDHYDDYAKAVRVMRELYENHRRLERARRNFENVSVSLTMIRIFVSVAVKNREDPEWWQFIKDIDNTKIDQERVYEDLRRELRAEEASMLETVREFNGKLFPGDPDVLNASALAEMLISLGLQGNYWDQQLHDQQKGRDSVQASTLAKLEADLDAFLDHTPAPSSATLVSGHYSDTDSSFDTDTNSSDHSSTPVCLEAGGETPPKATLSAEALAELNKELDDFVNS